MVLFAMAPVSPQRSFGIGTRCLPGYSVIILLGLFALAIARPDNSDALRPDTSTGAYNFNFEVSDGNTVLVEYVTDEDRFRVLESNVGCQYDCLFYWGRADPNIWTCPPCTTSDVGQLTLTQCQNKCEQDPYCKAINYHGPSTTLADCKLVSCPGPLPLPCETKSGWNGYKLFREFQQQQQQRPSVFNYTRNQFHQNQQNQQFQQNQQNQQFQQNQQNQRNQQFQQNQQNQQFQQNQQNQRPIDFNSNCCRYQQQQQRPSDFNSNSNQFQQPLQTPSPAPVLRWIGPKSNIWASSQCSLTHKGAMPLEQCQSEARLEDFNAINYKGHNVVNSTSSDCVLVKCPSIIPAPGLNRPPYLGYEYTTQSGPPSV